MAQAELGVAHVPSAGGQTAAVVAARAPCRYMGVGALIPGNNRSPSRASATGPQVCFSGRALATGRDRAYGPMGHSRAWALCPPTTVWSRDGFFPDRVHCEVRAWPAGQKFARRRKGGSDPVGMR